MCMHSEGKEEEREGGRRVKKDCVCLKREEREHDGKNEPETDWAERKKKQQRPGGSTL